MSWLPESNFHRISKGPGSEFYGNWTRVIPRAFESCGFRTFSIAVDDIDVDNMDVDAENVVSPP